MKTVIEMARTVYGENTKWSDSQLERLEKFSELVRADVIADEREVCAMRAWSSVLAMTDAETADKVLAVIRARSNT